MANYYQILVGPNGLEMYLGSEKQLANMIKDYQYPIYHVFHSLANRDVQNWLNRHEAQATADDQPLDGVTYCWCDGGTWIHAQANHGTVDTDPSAWGYATDLPTEPRQLIHQSGAEFGRTNNYMELSAVINCLKRLIELHKQHDYIVMYLDSKYIYSAYTEQWINGWKKNNWTGKSDLKTKELWQELDQLKSQFSDLELCWVHGHAESEGNQLVHEICQNAMTKLSESHA